MAVVCSGVGRAVGSGIGGEGGCGGGMLAAGGRRRRSS